MLQHFKVWRAVRRRVPQTLWLLALLGAGPGCAALVEDAIGAACGESREERRDRQSLQGYRDGWSTPGRTSGEIETEARGSFRRANGRDANLNWHAR